MSNTDHDLLEQYLQDPDGFGLSDTAGLDPVLFAAALRGRVMDILSGKYRAPDSIALSPGDRARLAMAQRLQPQEKLPSLESIALAYKLKNALHAWKAARVRLAEHHGNLLDSMRETRKQMELAAKMGNAQISLMDPDVVWRGVMPETVQEDHGLQHAQLKSQLDAFHQQLAETREALLLQEAQAQVMEQLRESGLIHDTQK